MHPSVEHDAREFGAHVPMKGWRLGLLVARCVEPRQGARRATSPDTGKVTQAAFARAAGVNRETVALYLKAWDRAARGGIVPGRHGLEPGVDPELDFTALPLWEEYYEPRRKPGGWRSPRGGDDEWYTRPEFVEAAREVLGGIDLDPASCARAQEVVQATRYYSTERDEDGLKLPWSGRVFLNPPYSRGKVNAFCETLLREYGARNVEAAILVLNAYSLDTKWFRPFWDYPICFSARPAFYHPDKPGRPMVWAAFVYLGPVPDSYPFVRVFGRLGKCRDAPGNDRTLFERGVLQEQWDLLALDEERISGSSAMPERKFADEGVTWDRARLDEEWAALGREEERIRQRETATK